MSQNWHMPITLQLIESDHSESFREMQAGCTALPLPPHPGAFGVKRQHHIHEGVDLYCAAGTPVMAVEDGMVVARQHFTGEKAQSPWWRDTEALLIEGVSGVVVYGEIAPYPHVTVGQNVKAGQEVGTVLQVLKEDKGRPMSMLHLELHRHGARDTFEWRAGRQRPPSLLDPTELLQKALQI